MTLADFNQQFDLYYNNIASNQAPGLNPYEKSVFLTDAQEEHVIALYNGRNPLGESFEQTEELRRYLSNLVLDATIQPYTPETDTLAKLDPEHSQFFKLPQNGNTDGETESSSINNYKKPWFIVYESIKVSSSTNTCKDNATMEVCPTRYDEYIRIKKNPFRGINERRALRFDYSEDLVEIVCKYPVTEYYIRYLRKPKPIILTDLEGGLTINGESTASNCELPDSLHKAILKRAVELAIESWNKT